MPQGTGDRLSSPLGQKRHRGMESPRPLTRPLQSAAKLKLNPSSQSSVAHGLLNRVPRRGQNILLNFFFFFNFSFLLTGSAPVPWSLEEKAGRCFWRCYYKNKGVFFFFLEGVLFGCLVEVKIWGYGVLLLLPFCKLHSWYFCSFHDCKLSRVGLAKRRLR